MAAKRKAAVPRSKPKRAARPTAARKPAPAPARQAVGDAATLSVLDGSMKSVLREAFLKRGQA